MIIILIAKENSIDSVICCSVADKNNELADIESEYVDLICSYDESDKATRYIGLVELPDADTSLGILRYLKSYLLINPNTPIEWH